MSASKPAVLLVKQIIKQSSGQPQWPAQSSDVAPHRRRWPLPARRGSRIAPAERNALDLPCPRSASDGNLSMKIWGKSEGKPWFCPSKIGVNWQYASVIQYVSMLKFLWKNMEKNIQPDLLQPRGNLIIRSSICRVWTLKSTWTQWKSRHRHPILRDFMRITSSKGLTQNTMHA